MRATMAPTSSRRAAASHPGARIRSPGQEAATRFGHAKCATRRPRPETNVGRASAWHRIVARDFERAFQSRLPRDRSCRQNLRRRTRLASGVNCVAKTANAKSPSAAKRVTCGDSIAAARFANNGSIRICRLRLESRERGHLDTLRFAPFELPPCGPGEVLIEVKAAGMNFRDVLKALALYPGDAPDARIFGDEVGGIVRAVGADVTHVAPGDRVFGLAVFGLATHTIARGGDVRRIPGEPDIRRGRHVAGGLHDLVACAAKRGATAQRRTHPRPRRRGRRRHGGDPDCASSRRGSDRHRRQPEQTRSAQNARRRTRDRLASRRFCRSGD